MKFRWISKSAVVVAGVNTELTVSLPVKMKTGQINWMIKLSQYGAGAWWLYGFTFFYAETINAGEVKVMETLAKIGVIQNLGLADRVLRLIIGISLLGGAIAHMQMNGNVVSAWHALAGLVSVYPFLTGIVGWDPLYSLLRVRTCSLTGKNQCGTFPYEVDAALGHNPKPEKDFDHSLTGSRH